MPLKATLTGSWPPIRFPPPELNDKEARASIRAAVRAQRDAIRGTGIPWVYVDGQPRSDIIGLFAPGLGIIKERGRYFVRDRIAFRSPITLSDLQYAALECRARPLKAHVTDPLRIAEACNRPADSTPKRYRGESGFEPLVFDIAEALAEEARAILGAGIPIEYLQVDAPELAYGANLALAHEAIGVIARVAREAGVRTILHVCGNTGHIVEPLLQMPVDILNVEASHLREWAELTPERLAKSGKMLALGCLPVRLDVLPSIVQLQRELDLTFERCGAQHIWGLTPNCGLRMSFQKQGAEAHDGLARKVLDRLVQLVEENSDRWSEGE